MDLVEFNAQWLQAWTDKSVDRILGFYHPDIEYFDENVPHGLRGISNLGSYFSELFSKMPEWLYRPDMISLLNEGYCGRWYLGIGSGSDLIQLRGFDYVTLKADLIIFNEVYLHRL